MPKETFHNLSEEKRNQFMQVALQEFASFNYDAASINRIIQKLGIARGSVYQYFENKLDLWLYLKEYSEGVKTSYILEVNRADYTDFWEYFRALYIGGLDFDMEAPLCSQFLYRIGFKENSQEVATYLDGWKKKAREMLGQMVGVEKGNGSFDPSLSTEIIVHFLITMSLSIAELLQDKYHVNFDENIKQGKMLFANNRKELEGAVSELIQLLENALKSKQ